MIACYCGTRQVGSCSVEFNNKIKTRHRATVAIALVKDFWNLGLGTFLMNELIAVSKERKVTQLELLVVEGNERAKALYTKLGFTVAGAIPNAIKLKDGRVLKEEFMIKPL